MKSEDRIQQEIFTWMWNTYPATRRCFFHVPNEGKRGKLEAIRLKAMGVVAGIPDLILVWGGKAYGFEVKTDVGIQSPIQKQVQQAWQDQDTPIVVVRSLEGFQVVVNSILSHVNIQTHG